MSDAARSLTRRELLKAGAALGALAVAGPARTARSAPAMPYDDYAREDAVSLAALVRAKQASPSELLEAAIARTLAVDGALNAVVLRHLERAREAVRRGLSEGPLRGVPFLLKDLNIALAGTVTTNGSRFFADATAERNSSLVDRYEAAGLVIFGKTASPEFGATGTTESRLGLVMGASLVNRIQAREKALGRAVRADDLELRNWESYQRALTFTAAQHEAARQDVYELGRAIVAHQDAFDVVISPTLAIPAAAARRDEPLGRLRGLRARGPGDQRLHDPVQLLRPARDVAAPAMERCRAADRNDVRGAPGPRGPALPPRGPARSRLPLARPPPRDRRRRPAHTVLSPRADRWQRGPSAPPRSGPERGSGGRGTRGWRPGSLGRGPSLQKQAPSRVLIRRLLGSGSPRA